MDEIYKKYFDSVPSYLTVQDKELHLLSANNKFRKDFGEIDGRYCYQVYKNRSEKCEVCPVEKTFRDGLPHSSEERIKTRNGNDVWVLVNTAPILDSEGNISAVMEMSTDITDAKNVQNQLRQSQHKYHLVY